MINKDSFVKIMDTLRDYNDKIYAFYDVLGVNMDDNVLTKVLDDTMTAIVEDVEPNWDDDTLEVPWCYYYAFDCNWGRDVEGKNIPFSDAAELYDYLTKRGDVDA